MMSSDRSTFSLGFKRLLFIVAALNGLGSIKQVTQSFFVPTIYKKDFLSPYLMAKAIINGDNPYLPLPEIASRWLVDANNYSSLRHPTPHTPALGLLSLPLGFLSYEAASIAWFVIELACLLATIILLLYWWKKPVNPQSVIIPFGLALGWLPVQEGLWLGQLNTCLLLLMVGSWLTLREGKDIWGGALLGGILALKLIAWPIIIFLALHRRWRGVFTAGVVLSVANLLAVAVLGLNCVKDYYLRVGPFVAAFHRPQDCNISTWTVGQRLFGGVGYYSSAPPLWWSPSLTTFCTYVIPLIVLMIGVKLARQATNFDSAFWGLVVISILVSPIAWTHYLILVVIPIGIIARQFWGKRDNRKLLYLALCLGLPLSIIGGIYQSLSRLLTSLISPEGIGIVLSARILPFIPAIALMGLFWVLWRLDHPSLSNE